MGGRKNNKLNKTFKRQHIYLDQATAEKLRMLSSRAGQSKSSIMRILIDGATIREMPPADYHAMTAELNAIGNNLNQIAHVANATGKIDASMYQLLAQKVQKEISEIKLAVCLR